MTLFSRKGNLYANVTINGQRRRFTLKRKDTPANRAWALANEAAILKEHTQGVKVSIAAKRRLERAIGLKPSTQRTFHYSLKRVIELLTGGVDCNTMHLNSAHVSQFYKRLIDGHYSHAHTKTMVFYLKDFLEFCTQEGYIEKNPFFTQKITNTKPPKKIIPFSLEQIKRVLAHAKDAKLKAFLTVAFFTGARTGELLALRWEDVDFKKDTITIKATYNYTQRTTQTPKTKSSTREIDMLPVVKRALMEFANKIGGYEPHREIFAYKRMRLHNIAYAWKNLLSALGMPHSKLYTTRHTFASLMLSRGEDPLWVSHTLGHKNLEITYRVYAHYIKKEHTTHATFLDKEFS
ncbi:site-specific integrase [Helicobacter ailurogastricus]|uniref:Phage integrase n=1 Tax=Helicobacter ailurogastricus TaxID=1578720 RepID=A0A0K2Y7B5_9HELI|nr:site-specific integrase [Helicobacter ailurogastricus]CRI32455.1 Phage integrase [Helicobacter ailurogastricus]